MSYVSEMCPHCYNNYAIGTPLSSGLGPPDYICSVCNKPYSTRRVEWSEMTALRKAWYCLVSGIYVIIVGFSVGAVIDDFAGHFYTPAREMTKPPSSPEFWVAAIVGGLAMAAFQWRRVQWSVRRHHHRTEHKPVASFWSFEMNPAFYVMAGLALFIFLLESSIRLMF